MVAVCKDLIDDKSECKLKNYNERGEPLQKKITMVKYKIQPMLLGFSNVFMIKPDILSVYLVKYLLI